MKVLMFSGGMDSTILFYDLLTHGTPFMCVFVDYAQKNVEAERRAVTATCTDFLIKLRIMENPLLFARSESTLLAFNEGKHTVASDEVVNRNALLANYVAANLPTDDTYELLFAAHRTPSRYADATPQFYTRLSKLLSWSTDGRVTADAPYIYLTKKQLVKKAIDLAITPNEMNNTVSCYEGNNCGKCPACKSRKEALRDTYFENNNFYY